MRSNGTSKCRVTNNVDGDGVGSACCSGQVARGALEDRDGLTSCDGLRRTGAGGQAEQGAGDVSYTKGTVYKGTAVIAQDLAGSRARDCQRVALQAADGQGAGAIQRSVTG